MIPHGSHTGRRSSASPHGLDRKTQKATTTQTSREPKGWCFVGAVDAAGVGVVQNNGVSRQKMNDLDDLDLGALAFPDFSGATRFSKKRVAGGLIFATDLSQIQGICESARFVDKIQVYGIESLWESPLFCLFFFENVKLQSWKMHGS